MENQKELFNIPIVINVHGKDYKFTSLTIYQTIELKEYCIDKVKKEIIEDGERLELSEEKILPLLRDDITSYIGAMSVSLEGVLFNLKLSLSQEHSKEEIEELFNKISIEEMYGISTKLANYQDAKIEEIDNGAKKKGGQMQKRKKKISPSN